MKRFIPSFMRKSAPALQLPDSQPKTSKRKIATVLVLVLVNVGVWLFAATYYRDNKQHILANSWQLRNGFTLDNLLIPETEIKGGGPPRDGIPAIDNPKFTSLEEATYMSDSDTVFSVERGGETKAYPLRILVWHEIVNDVIGGEAVAVTYCPLCGTCMAFSREIDGKTIDLGVSGLLYNSDVLMYDRQTESLWSQLKMQAVSGKYSGESLTWLPGQQMDWASWKKKYPEGKVLSRETGAIRDYNNMPYKSYFESDDIIFPVNFSRKELRRKDWVIGVIIEGVPKAYPLKTLEKLPDGRIEDQVAGKQITLEYDAGSRHAQAYTEKNDPLPHVMVYWFAWQAFYPETELY